MTTERAGPGDRRIDPVMLGQPPDELLRLLVSSVRDYAIFLLDPSGNVASWNIGAERIKGYRAGEIIGRHFSAFYPPEDVAAGKCEMELECATRDGRFEDEGWRVRSDGSQFWANVVITALRDASGALRGFAKVTRDLTERKRVEDERQSRLAAEQANQIKDAFLALLGHELRNPLAPIVTAVQLIKLRGSVPAPREIEVIERQLQLMTNLVDDLLDVSRVTRGTLTLKKQLIDAREAVSRGIEIASPLIEQKGHRLTVSLAPEPLRIDGDLSRLTQAFANLLTNAAKYTDAGGHIQVTLAHAADHVVAQIRDDGTGIAVELLPKIFDLFVQGSSTSERTGGGLGLGLTLVRSVVQLHGGSVHAHSDGPGTGSTFTVSLPAVVREMNVAAAPERSDPLPRTTRAASILLVDDNDDVRTLLADLLRQHGYEVLTAVNGNEALALLTTFAADIAILDIGLPDMDGYELAARTREARRDRPIHLIAMSGYGQATDVARGEAAGFERHLVKPVGVRQLLEALASLDG
jgi:PAS domain S-box-containing protein